MVAGLPLLVPLTGCLLAADLVNPTVLSAVGLDPATIIPPQGRVLIAFQNSTQGVAAFAAVAYDSALDAILVSATDVAANETRTMVVDCPVGAVIPLMAGTVVNDALAEVVYAGAPLVAGTDFVCGDVIEVRLIQLGAAADAAAFEMQVQVLAGR